MILKLLGLIDILMALVMVLVQFEIDIGRLYLLIMFAHAIKAITFYRDILSLLDLAIVAYTLILPFWSSPLLTILIAIFLFYKGAYSFA